MLVALNRRFEGLASVDPDELARLLLEDEEFRRRVMEAIAATAHQKATNSQFGIAKGQENDSPEAWHLVSADEGLLSINRTGLEAFVASLIKDAIDAIPPGGGNGGNCHCPPPAVKPLDWQTFCGSLKAEVKQKVHLFAPFSFPKEMPKRIEFFDKLTFIPNNARETCGTRRPGGGCGCSGGCDGGGSDGGGNDSRNFVQNFSVNAFDPVQDFISDYSINAFDPTKDFVRDFSVSTIATRDYTQDFSIPAIRLVDFTQNFTVNALPLDEEFKFTIDTRQTDTGLNAPVASNRHVGFYVDTRRVPYNASGSIGVPYDWWINWGDGTPLQRVSGVPQNSIPSRDYIEKTYATPGRYQITIKPAQEFNSWLWGFIAAPEHGINNKIVSLDSPLTIAMFAPIGSRVPRAMSGYNMFAGCRGIDFHLGNGFGFAPEWETVSNAGTGFFSGAFMQSRITAIPDSFNLPQGIRQCGEFFCSGMFSMCDLIRVPSAFRFPQLHPDHRGIEQQGVFTGTFRHLENRSFAREPIPASVIINGNPVPSSSRQTFQMFNDTRGRERWSDWNSIHSNWK